MSDSAGSREPRPSLYTRIGGKPAVEGTVKVFYDRILADKRVSKFFSTTDMRHLRRKLVGPGRLYTPVLTRATFRPHNLVQASACWQAVFVVYSFGGSAEYSGQELVAALNPLSSKEPQ